MRSKIAVRNGRFTVVLLTLLIVTLAVPTALAKEPKGCPTPVRFASFNRFNAGDLVADLSTPDNAQRWSP
jgi:hypothetical protein